MAGIKLQKRANDFFISYGHTDLPRVGGVVNWLRRLCGLKIWFDSTDGGGSTRSSELLAAAIGNARGALFFLSKSWKQSTWCKGEFEVALAEQRAHDGFEVVAIRLDDLEPPPWFNVAEIIDLRGADTRASARLLRSLASDVPHRFDNEQDVYLAAPWSRPSALARDAFAALARAGWRLVGDSQNQAHQPQARIEAIMRTVRGVIALLPYDAASQLPHATSPFILQEAEIAAACGKPLLLLAEPGVVPPGELAAAAFGPAVPLAAGPDSQSMLAGALENLDEHLQRHDDTKAFIFLAASLRGAQDDADDLTSVIEHASNMRCVRGERLTGDNAQQAIVDLIRRAALIIADVSEDHRNTLIETGIAMGAGTTLKLIVHAPGGQLPKKRFMYEGQEYHGYSTPEERLGLCYYFARQVRRRVYVLR